MPGTCTFCNLLDQKKALEETNHFSILREGAPVSPGHLLIVSNRHYEDAFALRNDIWFDFSTALQAAKELTAELNPDGYNIGMNCGHAAGQTQMHFHAHFIPRFVGDIEDPTGGVRNIFPKFVPPMR